MYYLRPTTTAILKLAKDVRPGRRDLLWALTWVTSLTLASLALLTSLNIYAAYRIGMDMIWQASNLLMLMDSAFTAAVIDLAAAIALHL